MQDFSLPQATPGQRKGGIVLQLRPATMIELELVGAQGQRLVDGSATIRQRSLMPGWRKGAQDGKGTVLVEAALVDGKEIRSTSRCGPDGIWTLQLDAEPSAIVELAVYLPGYEPARERPVGALHGRVHLRLELAELPSLRLRLVAKDPDAKQLAAPVAPFHLHACLAGPERFADPNRDPSSSACCGAGAFWAEPWTGDAREIVLPVRKPGSYWIYAQPGQARLVSEAVASFGPFETGETLHEIAFDTTRIENLARRERTTPPDPSTSRRMPTAELTAFIVDARTGQGSPERGWA
jgi:hypothetical protein